MAITAWSAKVSTISICFAVNGFTSGRVSTKTPTGSPFAQQGHAETGPITATLLMAERLVVGVCQHIGYVDRLAAKRDPSRRAAGVHREGWPRA